jgi:hypothetical protein
VGSLSPEQHDRIIEPLVEAGLELEQVRVLLFRLAFEAIVSEGSATLSCLTDLVSDQPPEIRAAWVRVIGRMIALGASGSSVP